MNDDSVRVSICIVNHRTPELTQRCLESIARTCHNLAIEVILTNNTADPCPLAASVFGRTSTQLRFIQNTSPQGFAANQNAMFRIARGNLVLALNSDTEVKPHAIERLTAVLESSDDIGVTGPRLEYADGRLQPSCRNFPSFLPVVFEVTGLWRLFKGSRTMGRWIALCNPHDKRCDVEWLTGACLLVRRRLIDTVGGFDELLFPGMYGEDVEWCWRIRSGGWRIVFEPTATVVHLENQSSSADRLYDMYHGSVKFMRKSCPWLQRVSVHALAAAGVAAKWLQVGAGQQRKAYGRIFRLLVTGQADAT